jgi:CRISPR/Cas system CSM-associated protein Csm5 (group 7 of RAMP superfamily)
MEDDKIIYDLKLKALTPVHIGGAQEKHFQKGIDYLVIGRNVYFLDERKIVDQFGIDTYSNALSKGDITNLLRSVKIENFTKKIIKNLDGEIGTDIKQQVKNSLTDCPYIPGSSLKGSIRSALLNYLKPSRLNNNRDIEQKVFGKIMEDPMRFIQVTDTEFKKTKYFNTKTFNLFQRGRDSKWEGGWKHALKPSGRQRFTTDDSFQEEGFTFPHECIAPDSLSNNLKIVINKKAFTNALREQKKSNKSIVKTSYKLEKILSGEVDFLKILQEYSTTYIEKEIQFFETFETDYVDEILFTYQEIKKVSESNPILRLGLGSGFHSMTGDWQFHDHTKTGFHRGGYNNGKMRYKSRKLAFDFHGSDDDGYFRFYPMGFVQLIKN